MDGARGGIKDRFSSLGKTIGMQSEPRRPQIIHGDTPPKAKQREECPHIGGHVVKRAPMTSASEGEGGGSAGFARGGGA